MAYTNWQQRIVDLEKEVDGIVIPEHFKSAKFFDGTKEEFEAQDDAAIQEFLKDVDPVDGMVIFKERQEGSDDGNGGNGAGDGEEDPDNTSPFGPDYSEDIVPYTEPVAESRAFYLYNCESLSSASSITWTANPTVAQCLDYYSGHKSYQKYGKNIVDVENHKDGFNFFVKVNNYSTRNDLEFFGYDGEVPSNITDYESLKTIEIPANCIKQLQVINNSSTAKSDATYTKQIISKRERFILLSDYPFYIVHLVIKKSIFASGIAITSDVTNSLIASNVGKTGAFLNLAQGPKKNLALISTNRIYDGDPITDPNSKLNSEFIVANNSNECDNEISLEKATLVNSLYLVDIENSSELSSKRYIASPNTSVGLFISIDPSKVTV